MLRQVTRLGIFQSVNNGFNKSWAGSAATSYDVDKAAVSKFTEQLGHLFRSLIILPHFVGQPSIRVSTDMGVGNTR